MYSEIREWAYFLHSEPSITCSKASQWPGGGNSTVLFHNKYWKLQKQLTWVQHFQVIFDMKKVGNIEFIQFCWILKKQRQIHQ